MSSRPLSCLGRRAAAAAVALALLLGASACTGGEDRSDPDRRSESQSRTDRERSVPTGVRRTSVRIGQVAGQLSAPRRKVVVRDAGRVVDRWFRRAWLDDRPERGAAAFPGFSAGARALARGDRSVLTADVVGRKVDAVVPRTRSVVLDVLSPGGTPAAVTARFRLGLTPFVADRGQDRVVVTGRLMLTRAGDRRWQVVGYDVATALPDRKKARKEAGGQPDRQRSGRERTGKRPGKKAAKIEKKKKGGRR